MPKRIKTPPPPDDEPRYLTVVHPYPLHANLELHADRRTLALWLACCTGNPGVLLAMYHKPTSPGMVVVEVDRDFDRFDDMLGTHSWRKVLSNPTNEESDKSSKVFWCTYNSGRLVQKHGWKRVDIQEHWFKGWKPDNSKIKSPYPKTTYCNVPSEAKTGEPMCRPLPQKSFPVPPPPPAPPVGSAEWFATRNGDATPGTSTPLSKKNGKKATQSDSGSTTGSASRNARSPPPPSVMSPIPVSPIANYRAKQDAWKRGPPSAVSVSPAASSRTASTVTSRQGASTMSSRTSAPASATPPSLSIKQPTPQVGAYEGFNWSDEVDRNEANQNEAPPTPTASNISVNLGSDRYTSPPHRGRGRDPDGPVDPDQAYDYYEEDRPRRTTAAAMEDLFDDDDDDFDDDAPRVAPVRNRARPRGVQEVGDNLWEGYDAPRQEPQTKIRRVNKAGQEKGKEDWFCPEHGPMCNPGICKARAKHERDIRWAEEQAKRDEERAKRIEAGARRARRRERREAGEAEGNGAPRNKPPGSANRSGGGCKGSSRSGSGSDDSTGTEGCRLRSQDERENTASPEHPPPPVSPREDDWTTEGVLWDGDDDARSTVSSARRAWSVAGEEDDYGEEAGEGDETQSVASARTSTTGWSNNTGVSRRTGASSAQRSAVSVRTTASDALASASPVDLTAAAVAAHAAQSSPAGRRQPASDTRSVASARTSTTVWSNRTGVSRRTGASSSSAQRGAASGPSTAEDMPTSPSVETPISSASLAAQKGFPAFAETTWGDTITKTQAAAKKGKKSGSRKKKKAAIAQLEQPPLLEVELPPGGPGNWGDPKVAW